MMRRALHGSLRVTLLGLLVLAVVVLAAPRVHAVVMFVTDTVAEAAFDGDDDTDQPCPGHEHGTPCCLLAGCPVLMTALPTIPRFKASAVPSNYNTLLISPPKGQSGPPAVPPPRTLV
jgi:hypothetical protein